MSARPDRICRDNRTFRSRLFVLRRRRLFRRFARAIARDLGAFVSSFERPPADVVDRWLRRFDEKYARDPSYFLKA